MDIKVFFLYTITAIGCFIFLKYKIYIDKCITKSIEKIGILWQLIVMPLFFYGIHKATYEIYLETNNDELGSENGLILYLVLINLLCIAYTLEKLAKAFSEKRSFFSLLPTIIAILFAIALNFAVQYNILFDYEKEAFVNIQPECWYKDLANFFFYSFGVLTSSIITQIAAASILAKVLVTLEVLSAFIFIILIIGNYKAIGESLSNLRFLHGENNKKEQQHLTKEEQ
nr:hypothetical protein [uncultured Alloprevotella sp.]